MVAILQKPKHLQSPTIYILPTSSLPLEHFALVILASLLFLKITKHASELSWLH